MMNRICVGLAGFAMICRLTFACGMLAVMAGCSSSAMKSAPLWDPSSSGAATLSDMEYKKAQGPPEDRVNLWPLYYYRKPATSVLWPMIAVTDEGNAVIPFYEYLYKDKELRMGMIHHYIPALANVNGAKDCYRILTFFKGPDATWFVPFFYDDKETFWSLLYTQSRSDAGSLYGFLGPLFLINKNRKNNEGTTAFFPFPIFEYWNRASEKGSMALPLYYYEWNKRADKMATLNLAGLLLHLNLDESWYFYLAGLGAGSHKKSTGDGFDYFFPFFINSRDGADYYQSLLFPFFHRFGDKESSGSMMIPIYYYSENANGYKSTVTPLFGFDNQGTYLHVGGPAYYYSNRDGVTWRSFLWPVFWSRKDNDSLYRSCLFPIWNEYYDNDVKRIILAPLFWSERDAKRWEWISLPVSFGRSKDGKESVFNIGGLIFHYLSDPNHTTCYFPCPFFGYEKYNKGDKRSFWMFPLFSYSREPGVTSHLSLLISLLFDSRIGHPANESREAIFNIIKEDSTKRGRAAYRWWERKPHPENDVTLLLGLGEWESGFKVHSEIAASTITTPAGARRADLSSTQSLLVTYKDYRESHLHPFYMSGATEGEGSYFNLIYRLFDSKTAVNKKDGTTYQRQRVLWRLYHREAEGTRLSVDMFPFVAYDRDENMKKFTFAAGLFGFGYKNEQRYVKILWAPIRY